MYKVIIVVLRIQWRVVSRSISWRGHIVCVHKVYYLLAYITCRYTLKLTANKNRHYYCISIYKVLSKFLIRTIKITRSLAHLFVHITWTPNNLSSACFHDNFIHIINWNDFFKKIWYNHQSVFNITG